MMFLIRTTFWLVILILLLPTDEDQQNQIYGTAQAAVNDVAGFCDRNPQTCATGQDAFAVLMQKAQYGAQMVMAFVEGHSGSFAGSSGSFAGDGSPEPVALPAESGVMPVPSAVPLEPMAWETSASQDTLNPEDREAAWGGPDV